MHIPHPIKLRRTLAGCLIFLATFSGIALWDSYSYQALSAEEFNDVQCQSDFADKDLCNVRFFSKFMSARLVKSGSNTRIPYKNIYRWSYENASLRKRSGIFSSRVEHIHIFTILYRDEQLGSSETLIVDFDDIKYVPPMKALLNDILPEASTK